MNALELKQSLLVEINSIDDRETQLLQKLAEIVRNFLKQSKTAERNDEAISPFVKSMEMGVKLPADLDIRALRDEHIREKYL